MKKEREYKAKLLDVETDTLYKDILLNKFQLNNKRIIKEKNKKDSINLEIKSDKTQTKKNSKVSKQKKYIYSFPGSYISNILFLWVVRILKLAKKQKLKFEDLGNFKEGYSSDYFKESIISCWENIRKHSKSNHLVKAVLKSNLLSIVIIIIFALIFGALNIGLIIVLRQELLHFGNQEKKPIFSLSTTSIILFLFRLGETSFFRFFEFYSGITGSKITIQLNTLIYNKLLKISTFADYNIGEIINFVSLDAEKIAEFISYTPGSFVFPFQLIFYIYLLFCYLGLSSLIGISILLIVFFLSSLLEKEKIKYEKIILELKDKRIKTTTQAFDSIKIVKLYSWEQFYINRIQKERDEELAILKKIESINLVMNFIFGASTGMMTLGTMIAYNLFNSKMDISNIFASIYIILNMENPLFVFPEYITGFFDSIISLGRIESFLELKECNPNQLIKNGEDREYAIKIENLDFGIIKPSKEKNKPSNITPLLHNITFKAEYGDLIGIIGEVGAGKTCLFNAILNTLDITNSGKTKNKILVNGSVSYVSQQPWILNETVRNNILFFKEMDEGKYNRIVDICELNQDFEILPGGDLTEIGDKGTNLSGGQKARVALARALYSDTDIYLLDDPFSALDAYVGMKIFENVIKTYLKDKTVIIITHAIQYIPRMNHICYIQKGTVDWYGTSDEAIKMDFYQKYCKAQEHKKQEMEKQTNLKTNNSLHEIKKEKGMITETEVEEEKFIEKTDNNKNKVFTLTKKEEELIHPNKSILAIYINMLKYIGGITFIILIVFLNLIKKFLELASDYLLSIWSLISNLTKEQNRIFLIIYFIISILAIIMMYVISRLILDALLNYNNKMHQLLISKLMKAPINLFHDIVPRGHILNRLSKDLNNSINFFWSFHKSLTRFVLILFSIALTFYCNFFALIVIPFLAYALITIYKYYTNAQRDLSRLEGASRSPIISGFSETIYGIVTIREYEYQEKFRNKYHQKLDNFYKTLIFQDGILNWYALNLNFVWLGLLFFTLAFIVLFKEKISSDKIAMLLTYLINTTEEIFYFFEQFSLFRKYTISIERCDMFTKIIQEKSSVQEGDSALVKNNFPYEGKIEFVNYSVKYRPTTKTVLKNLNFTINPREKIGVVGRTGSGKSTLCLSIFRILEPENGTIFIDDVDITKIGLKFLREILTIIPQDPTLIEGTIRENIDPMGKFDDNSIIENLKKIGLDYLVKDSGLNFEIREGGQNISVGERQLICIARALLRNSKIILMDEATSSIDYKSENLIQNTIFKSLNNSTVITVAHRIKTIIDYDRILAFENGELIEFGKPSELIESKKGLFYTLYSQSNI